MEMSDYTVSSVWKGQTLLFVIYENVICYSKKYMKMSYVTVRGIWTCHFTVSGMWTCVWRLYSK